MINWTMPANAGERTIIQIDLNPEMLGNNFKNALSVAGDARLVTEDLAVLLKSRTVQRKPSDWVTSLNRERAKFWKDAEKQFALGDIPLKPQRVVAEGFGLSAQRVNTPEELSQSLRSAFSGNQPVFIDVVTEPEVESLPPVYT